MVGCIIIQISELYFVWNGSVHVIQLPSLSNNTKQTHNSSKAKKRSPTVIILSHLLFSTMTYLWVFGFTMELKLQRVTPKVTHQTFQASKKGSPKDSGKPGNLDSETCPKMSPCSLSPDVVRCEAEGHRADFNFKMKRALFQSFICAYYVGFIPMRFSKVSL